MTKHPGRMQFSIESQATVTLSLFQRLRLLWRGKMRLTCLVLSATDPEPMTHWCIECGAVTEPTVRAPEWWQ